MVKLGGSLLTDKTRPRTARAEVIRRLAEELAAARASGRAPAVLLGHGSGSFGHVAAKRYGLGGARGSADPVGTSATQRAARRLHEQVLDALTASGTAPISLAPSSFLLARDGRPRRVFAGPAVAALAHGALPVVYGDVVLDETLGATIASTETVLDRLVAPLSRAGWRVRRFLWLGSTDGVYDATGTTIPEIDRRSLRTVRRWVGETAGIDVTGGMLLRLQAASSLARRGIESWIVNGLVPGLLTAALCEEPVPGTRFLARDV